MATKLKLRRKKLQKFMRKCPTAGGTCLNPMCMFGCIER